MAKGAAVFKTAAFSHVRDWQVGILEEKGCSPIHLDCGEESFRSKGDILAETSPEALLGKVHLMGYPFDADIAAAHGEVDRLGHSCQEIGSITVVFCLGGNHRRGGRVSRRMISVWEFIIHTNYNK